MVAEDEFEVGPESSSVSPGRSRRRPTRPSALPWVLAALGLVAAGVVVAPADSMSLDGYPPGTVGMLAVDATAPPEDAWRAPIGGSGVGYQSVTVIGETVVALANGSAVGLSLGTGEERWRVPADITTCAVRRDVTCVEQPGEPDAVVVRIDPSSGNQQRMELPYAVVAVGLGGDVVALAARDDETELQRVGTDGAPRWVSMVDATGALVDDDRTLAAQAQLAVVGDRAYLALGILRTALDATSGAAVDSDGVVINTTSYGYVRPGLNGGTFALLDDDGRVLFEDLSVLPDDDPGGPTLDWDGQRLVVASGEDVIWESAMEGDESELPLARVDGVLVTRMVGPTSGDELTGRDAGTGEVLWSTAAGMAYSVLAAAGATLLTAGASEALTGIDVRSGETWWTYGAAPPTALALLPDGVVLLLGDEVVRLTWERTT